MTAKWDALYHRVADLDCALRVRQAHLRTEPQDPKRKDMEQHIATLRRELSIARNALLFWEIAGQPRLSAAASGGPGTDKTF